MRGLTRPVAALLCAATFGGCYRYAVAAPGALPSDGHVRVALTDAGVVALAPVVGASVNGLEGSVVRQTGDTLVVRADRLLTTANVDVAWTGGDLALPAAWRESVGRRELAVGRTAAVTAGGIALVGAVIAIVRSVSDQGGDPGGGGDPIGLRRGRP